MSNIKLQVINQGDNVILVRKCPWCGKEVRKSVNAKDFYDGVEAYSNGSMIQDAFPMFTADVREMMQTGICDECWNDM